MNKAGTKKKSDFRNPIVLVMRARFGKTTTVYTNRNRKRRGKDAWRKDEERAWDGG
jgi:hypothetical protein